MRRHRKHIAATVAKAHEAHEIAHGADLLGEIRSLHGKAVGILEEAEAAGRPQTALSAIRECRATLELLQVETPRTTQSEPASRDKGR